MSLSESLEAEAVRVLDSTECLCGRVKTRGHSFCRPCYFALPAQTRQKLYTPLSEGYAEIWDEARCYLQAQVDKAGRRAK